MSGRRSLALALAVAAVQAAAATPASATLLAARAIDGPNAQIVSLGGVALAQDASGAVAYSKTVAGVAHVFAATLAGGAWSAPVQLDGGVSAAAGRPVLAAASGGRVAVVWIAGGELYGAVRASAGRPFSAPQPIAAAQGTPALAMGISGSAYVAFLAPDGGASDILAARLDRLSTAFTSVPGGSLAGAPATLSGTPSVAVSADATALVAWTQAGSDGRSHVLARRVSLLVPSAVTLDAGTPVSGGPVGQGADSPAVGIADDSTYAWIALREVFPAPPSTATRVVVRELIGDELQAPQFVDSLGPAGAAASSLAAGAPSLAINGGGAGLLALGLSSNALAVSALTSASTWGVGEVASSAPGSVAALPVAALARGGRGTVVLASSPTVLTALLISGSTVSSSFAPASAALGPADPGAGYGVATDARGDTVVALVQGAGGALSVTVAANVLAPGRPVLTSSQRFVAQRRPIVSWKAADDAWAAPSYELLIDRRVVARTRATVLRVPRALSDGTHDVQVVALGVAGQRSSSSVHLLRVDAAPPSVSLTLQGAHTTRTPISFDVRALAASGVRSISVSYGDGGASTATHSVHSYASAGSYTVTVTVTNGLGVRRTLRVALRIRGA